MRQFLILLPLAAALALSGCKKPPAKSTEAQQARAVSVVRVEMLPIAGALAGSGDLVSREEAAVYPEVAGFRAARVLVDVGDTVKKGQVLCIIEAMKLMNEIDSEYDGEIVNVYVETGHPVQYGERLFAIRTSGSV